MLFDALNLFSEKQTLTAAAVSQKSIDLGPGFPMSGNSNGATDMEIAVIPTKTFAPTTGTLSIEVCTSGSRDATGKLIAPITVLAASGPIPAASLVAGARIPNMLRLPPHAKRYVALNYVPSATFTAGEITAGLVVTAGTI